jgi:16S rRNA (cytosine1402-N4)-methyltransferase
MNNNEHTPLFLEEIVSLLKERQINMVVDATFGEGGHGLNISKLGISVIGTELDPQMYQLGQGKIKETAQKNISLYQANFKDLAKVFKQAGTKSIGAAIFDLGLSMYQLRHSKQGFSINSKDSLDLRLNPKSGQTAAWLLNKKSPDELKEIVTRLVESRYALPVAQKILAYRQKRSIKTVRDLQEIISKVVPTEKDGAKLLRQLLQALRIEVNDEFNNLEQGLKAAILALQSGGLLFVLTYHSLEDRIVKRLALEYRDIIKPIQKVKSNKNYQFAKSAKLRAYEKYTN